MRIIAGTARGRQIISVPKHMMVKPISGRMRQSLFDILRPRIMASRFLDIFAGTGAVGLEALSRGADRVCFLEKDARCVKVIDRNLEKFGWAERGATLRADVTEPLSWVPFRSGVERFDIVFMGPPYRDEENNMLALSRPVLENVRKAGLLEDDAWIVVQHHKKEPVGVPDGLKKVREQKYGDTLIQFFRPA